MLILGLDAFIAVDEQFNVFECVVGIGGFFLFVSCLLLRVQFLGREGGGLVGESAGEHATAFNFGPQLCHCLLLPEQFEVEF